VPTQIQKGLHSSEHRGKTEEDPSKEIERERERNRDQVPVVLSETRREGGGEDLWERDLLSTGETLDAMRVSVSARRSATKKKKKMRK
jgi:hypothetical protein